MILSCLCQSDNHDSSITTILSAERKRPVLCNIREILALHAHCHVSKLGLKGLQSWIVLPCSHIARNPEGSWHDIPDIPAIAKEVLDSRFSVSTSQVVESQTSIDGETTKLLVQLQDGMKVEAVVMLYDTTG